MCAYKLCKVEFRYWGMQSKIERFIHDVALRKTMLKAHSQVNTHHMDGQVCIFFLIWSYPPSFSLILVLPILFLSMDRAQPLIQT